MTDTSTDLSRAYDALTAKAKPYSSYFAYYDGNQPVRYLTDRLRDIFKDITARFTQNFCAVVVDAELERIHLNHFQVGKDKELADRLNQLFVETGLNLDADDMRTAELVCGEAFICAEKSEEGAIEAYYNDPRLVHMFYESENPRRKHMAVKWWDGDDGRRYLNLYYPERIEYYVSKDKAANIQDATSFVPLDPPTAANPFEIIPVFHFRLDRRLIKSRLVNVTDPQDMVNKLTVDMMVSSEFGALEQRYVITGADISTLKNAPNEVWKLPPAESDTQAVSVGAFPATELANFWNTINAITANIAIVTRTPKHYLLTQSGDPSGEALIAMEAPLNKKAQSTINHEKPIWAELASYLLLLDGKTVPASAIEAIFDRPETVQPRTQAEIHQIDSAAGIPLISQLRDEGWTDEQLDQLRKDMAEAAALKTSATQSTATQPVEGSATTPEGAKALADIYAAAGLNTPAPSGA